MIIIRTIQDLKQLKDRHALSESYLNHLEEYFLELHECLGEDEPLECFSLEEHGYIVILESNDDVRNLEEVGLNLEDMGLLGSWPEYVEIETLSDNTRIYKIGILYNNDYMMAKR